MNSYPKDGMMFLTSYISPLLIVSRLLIHSWPLSSGGKDSVRVSGGRGVHDS